MVRSESPPSSWSSPPSKWTSPAIRRSSEDLPAPFAPVIIKASPAETEKPKPAKTLRPPRTQARSDPKSRIRPSPPHRRQPHWPAKADCFPTILLLSVDYLNAARKDLISPCDPRECSQLGRG